jgi:hypothetical protein
LILLYAVNAGATGKSGIRLNPDFEEEELSEPLIEG